MRDGFDPNAPSRDVLSIGGGALSFQPSELFKICLVIFFASYVAKNMQTLSTGGHRLGPFTLPPVETLAPLFLMLGLSLAIVVFARELGLAALILGVFLAMLYAGSNRISYVVFLGAIFAIGSVVVFGIFSYARARVSLLTNAFDPNVYYGAPPNSSYQIVQGLVAFGSGGVFGQGFGLGHPTFVPISTTDYIAAAFAEEFGFAGLLALIGLFHAAGLSRHAHRGAVAGAVQPVDGGGADGGAGPADGHHPGGQPEADAADGRAVAIRGVWWLITGRQLHHHRAAATSLTRARLNRSLSAAAYGILCGGGMAEWTIAAVLKTARCKPRGFESHSLRPSCPKQTPPDG